MYKLLLLDLDDTLLDSKGKISEENINAIRAASEKGCHVVICSGRSNMSLKKFNDQLKINDYTIGYNGGIIYKDDNIITCHYIDKKLVHDIISHCKNYNTGILMYQHGEAWIDDYNIYNKQYCERSVLTPHIVDDLLDNLTDEINKVILLGLRHDLDKVIKELPKDIFERCCTFFSHEYLFEFNPLNVTKGTALKELADILDIPVSETIAVGDNENDLPMIKEAGLGIAVKNAIPILKENAGYVTENDCNNSPISEIINKFIL